MVQSASQQVLGVDVLRRVGQAVVIAEGEIDYFVVPAFRSALRDAAALCEPTILVDLTRVSYIDSSGIYALYDTWREGDRRPDALYILLGNTPAARMVRLSGLDRIMKIELGMERPFC